MKKIFLMMMLTSSLFAIVMSATACSQSSQKQEETNDTVPERSGPDNAPDDASIQVELTPEFIAAIQKYDKLGAFSDGLAAVCKNKKWGYINTKGEEVIPCKFADDDEHRIPVRPFKEGLAAIRKNGKWGYINTKGEIAIPITIETEGHPGLFSDGLACIYDYNQSRFEVIDQKGKKVFEGVARFQYWLSFYGHNIESHIPQYINGEICIPTNETSVTMYNKRGEKVKVVNDDDVIRINEAEEFQANTRDYGQFECAGGDNGVFLIVMDELKGDVDYAGEMGWESSNMIRHYGYVNKKGNDTFSSELKARCKKLYEKVIEEEGEPEGDW